MDYRNPADYLGIPQMSQQLTPEELQAQEIAKQLQNQERLSMSGMMGEAGNYYNKVVGEQTGFDPENLQMSRDMLGPFSPLVEAPVAGIEAIAGLLAGGSSLGADLLEKVGLQDKNSAKRMKRDLSAMLVESPIPYSGAAVGIQGKRIPKFGEKGYNKIQYPEGIALQKKIDNDFEGAVKEYSKLEDAEGGKVINTDLARELSPEYLANRSLSANVHEASSTFAKKLYDRALARPKQGNEMDLITFTAGGTGAGKTSGLNSQPDLRQIADNSKAIFDTNMNTYKSAKKKIVQALDTGHEVAIVLTHRDPVESLVLGALTRAAKQEKKFGSGRTVPIGAHLETHLGARDTIRKLELEYADNPKVNVKYIDNSRGKGNAITTPFEDLPVMNTSKLKTELDDALEIEYKNKRISDEIYKGFKQEID